MNLYVFKCCVKVSGSHFTKGQVLTQKWAETGEYVETCQCLTLMAQLMSGNARIFAKSESLPSAKETSGWKLERAQKTLLLTRSCTQVSEEECDFNHPAVPRSFITRGNKWFPENIWDFCCPHSQHEILPINNSYPQMTLKQQQALEYSGLFLTLTSLCFECVLWSGVQCVEELLVSCPKSA